MTQSANLFMVTLRYVLQRTMAESKALYFSVLAESYFLICSVYYIILLYVYILDPSPVRVMDYFVPCAVATFCG